MLGENIRNLVLRLKGVKSLTSIELFFRNQHQECRIHVSFTDEIIFSLIPAGLEKVIVMHWDQGPCPRPSSNLLIPFSSQQLAVWYVVLWLAHLEIFLFGATFYDLRKAVRFLYHWACFFISVSVDKSMASIVLEFSFVPWWLLKAQIKFLKRKTGP